VDPTGLTRPTDRGRPARQPRRQLNLDPVGKQERAPRRCAMRAGAPGTARGSPARVLLEAKSGRAGRRLAVPAIRRRQQSRAADTRPLLAVERSSARVRPASPLGCGPRHLPSHRPGRRPFQVARLTDSGGRRGRAADWLAAVAAPRRMAHPLGCAPHVGSSAGGAVPRERAAAHTQRRPSCSGSAVCIMVG